MGAVKVRPAVGPTIVEAADDLRIANAAHSSSFARSQLNSGARPQAISSLEEGILATPAAPHVDGEQYHASLRVAELSAAIEFYTTRLGFPHAFSWGDSPTTAGVNLGETQLFLEAGAPSSVHSGTKAKTWDRL